MDIFFRTEKGIIRMGEKLQAERGYLTTSGLDGKDKYALINYGNDEKVLEILNKIDEILDKALKENVSGISIDLRG